MLTILLLVASQVPVLMCHGDKVCLAANEFRGHYGDWTEVMNTTKAGTVNAKEPALWNELEKGFRKLKKTRSEAR